MTAVVKPLGRSSYSRPRFMMCVLKTSDLRRYVYNWPWHWRVNPQCDTEPRRRTVQLIPSYTQTQRWRAADYPTTSFVDRLRVPIRRRIRVLRLRVLRDGAAGVPGVPPLVTGDTASPAVSPRRRVSVLYRTDSSLPLADC